MKSSLRILIVFIFIVGLQILFPRKSMETSHIPDERKTCVSDCCAQSSACDSPYYPFEKTGADRPAAFSQRWHREYEKNRNYGGNYDVVLRIGNEKSGKYAQNQKYNFEFHLSLASFPTPCVDPTILTISNRLYFYKISRYFPHNPAINFKDLGE